jgi:ABC-type arginine transport system permease subunit
VWPALVSQIIIVMLGSAVCGQISTQELSYYANLIQSRNFRAFEAFIVATAIYLALSMGAPAAELGWARASSSAACRMTLKLKPWSTSASGTSSATCCWPRAGRWRCR